MIELHSLGMFCILEQAQLTVLDGINLSVAVMLGTAIALPVLKWRLKWPPQI
jgi:hypothetical protein